MVRSLLRGMTLGLFLVGGVLLSLSPAQALTLSPPIIEAQVRPGETKELTVTVTNDELVPVELFTATQKFLPLGTNGQQQFLPADDLSGLPSWTFLSGANGTLAPREQRQVSIQIRIPQEAPQGGAYEAVFFSTQPPRGASSSNIGVRSRVGTLLLLTIGETRKAELVLMDWRLQTASSQSSVQGTVAVKIQNVGRTHVRPAGEVVVRNLFGHVVQREPLNPQEARVLPASEREFRVMFGSGGTGLAGELVDFGLGSYSVSLEGVEGLSARPATLHFFVLPGRLILLFVVFLLLLFLGIRAYRRRLVRALQSKNE